MKRQEKSEKRKLEKKRKKNYNSKLSLLCVQHVPSTTHTFSEYMNV